MLEYPWQPHITIYPENSSPTSDTRQGLIAQLDSFFDYTFDVLLRYQINDVIHLSVLNSVARTTDARTLALARKRIPAAAGTEDTTRFLINFLHEKKLAKPELVSYLETTITQNAEGKYTVIRDDHLFSRFKLWGRIAVKITEIMKWLDSNIPTIGGGFEDKIREMALVELGEKVGVKIQTSSAPVNLNIHTESGTPTYHKIPANSTIHLSTLDGVFNWDNGDRTARPASLTGVNGASLVKSRTVSGPLNNLQVVDNPDYVLLKDATYQLTHNLQLFGVRSTPILAPTVTTEQADLTIATGVTESVSLSPLFGGTRLTITAVSSKTTVATVQVNSTQTSMGVVAVSAGTSTITITATNESGSVDVDFTVTVT